MSKYKPSILGKYIKHISKKEGLSQSKLAHLSNFRSRRKLSRSFVEAIESGYRQTIDDTTLLDALAKTLRVPAKKLYRLDGFNIKNVYQQIGLNFKRAIDQHHITISQLKHLHITPTLIPMWCNGKQSPSLYNEVSVSKKLHLNIMKIDPYHYSVIKRYLNKTNNPLAKIRTKNGYSINYVARKTGIPNPTLLYDEKNERPTLKNLLKLSKFYHVKINSLVTTPYSLYNVYQCSKHIDTRLMIIRNLKEFTPGKLVRFSHHMLTMNCIYKIEHDKTNPGVNEISYLSIIYKIPFKALLILLNLQIYQSTKDINIGKILKEDRLNNHLRLKDIERKLHSYIKISGLSRWEHSHHLRDINILPYLANIYKLKCSELLKQLGITIKQYRGKINNKDCNLLSRTVI